MTISWKRTTMLLAMVLALSAMPAGAQTSRGPGSSGPVPTTGAEAEPPHDFSNHAFRLFLANHPELLRPTRIFDLGYDRTVRLALWNAPLGRVFYAMAAKNAMLGRTGLVHGGRALGAGLSLTALGSAVSPISGYVEALMPAGGSSHVSIGVHSSNNPARVSPAGVPGQ